MYVAWTGAADWGESGEANEVLYFDATALGVPVSYVEGAADEEEKNGHPDANESKWVTHGQTSSLQKAGTHGTVTLEFHGDTSSLDDETIDGVDTGAVYVNAPVAAKLTSVSARASASSPSSSCSPTSWVEIEELCWILNPTKYWALVHPGKAEPEGLDDWMDSTTAKDGSSMGSFRRHSMNTKQFGDKRRFERHHTLAKFYVAQVLLYAELCLGRSYNCIGKLETMFPFELVVSCMLNTLLPDEVRAAFAVLMAHLHVEREPQIHHQYPQLVRENMTHRSARIDPEHQVKFIMLIHRTSSIPRESTREPVATFRCCLHTTRVRECYIVLYSIVTLAYCKSRIQR